MMLSLPARWPSSRKKLGVLLAVLLLVSVFFVTSPQSANACGGWWWVTVVGGAIACGLEFAAGEAAEMALGLLELVLKFVLQLVVWLMQAMANFFTFVLFQLSQGVGFIGNDMVQAGWAVVRDVANWFFIIFFLASAIATILNLQRYNARSILPKLIVIAILINFSLFIGAFVVNIANGIAWIFTEQVAAGAAGSIGIGHYLAVEMGVAQLSDSDPSILGSTLADSDNHVANFANLGIGIIFLSVAAFVFGALALMFLIRIIYIWVLLILAPLAFITAIWPSTQSYWQRWVKDLVHWSFFAPIASFFIWLSTYLISYMNSLEAAGIVGDIEIAGGAAVFFITSADAVFRFITIIVFLLLALKASTQLTGAMGQGAANVAKTAMVGYGLMGGIAAGRKGVKLAGAGVQAGGRRAYRNIGADSEGGALADRVNRMMLRTPVLRRFGQQMSGTQREYREGRKARIDARELDKMPRRDLTENARGAVASASRGGLMTDEKAMSVLAAARKGIRIDMDDTAFRNIHDKLRETGQEGDFVAAYAHTAAEAGRLPDQIEGEPTEQALQRYYSSASGRRNIHLLQAGELADSTNERTGEVTDRSAMRSAVTSAMATNNINPNQSLRRMEQNENYEGYQALLSAMNERFVNPDTQDVHVEVDVRQLDAQGNFSEPQTTRTNNSIRTVLGAPTQQALMYPRGGAVVEAEPVPEPAPQPRIETARGLSDEDRANPNNPLA